MVIEIQIIYAVVSGDAVTHTFLSVCMCYLVLLQVLC